MAAGGVTIGRTGGGGGGGGAADAGFSALGALGCDGKRGAAGFSTTGGALGATNGGCRRAECEASASVRILISGPACATAVGTAAPQRVQYCAAGASVAPHFLQRPSTVTAVRAFSGGAVVATAAGLTGLPA
jgi:hypothetical protein